MFEDIDPRLKKEITVIDRPGICYHLSPDPKIDFFYPRPVDKYDRANGEDTTIERVCAAPTLKETLIGYGLMEQEAIVGYTDFTVFKNSWFKKGKWNGGYYVYEIPYERAFDGSSKLNPMRENINEIWLLNYGGQARRYYGKKICKCYVKSFIVDGVDIAWTFPEHLDETQYVIDNSKESYLTIVIKVESDIKFDQKTTLRKGCYEIIQDNKGKFEIKTLSSQEWKKLRPSAVTIESNRDDDILLNQFILKQTPLVVENVEPVYTPGIGYHITPDKNIPYFEPRPLKRIMPGEDVSVSRVCLGNHLVDAFRGYGVLLEDYLRNGPCFDDDKKWKGGYYIYEVPYQASLIPGVRLNPMAAHADERWLVNYQPGTNKYSGTIIGRFFIVSAIRGEINIPQRNRTDEEAKKFYHPLTELTLYLEVYPNENIDLTYKDVLTPGYYQIVLDKIGYLDGYYGIENIYYEKITSDQWGRMKQSKASLLSYQQPKLYQW